MQKINRERNNVVKSFRVDGVNVLACESKQELGLLAAEHVQVKIRELLKRQACIRMVFVTAPSQNEFLYNLTLSRENERCRIIVSESRNIVSQIEWKSFKRRLSQEDRNEYIFRSVLDFPEFGSWCSNSGNRMGDGRSCSLP